MTVRAPHAGPRVCVRELQPHGCQLLAHREERGAGSHACALIMIVRTACAAWTGKGENLCLLSQVFSVLLSWPLLGKTYPCERPFAV